MAWGLKATVELESVYTGSVIARAASVCFARNASSALASASSVVASVAMACSAALAVRAGPRSLLAVLLYLQIAFYSLALIGCTRPNAHWPALIGVPFYFSMVNAAAWLGSIRGVLGIEKVTWKKADR